MPVTCDHVLRKSASSTTLDHTKGFGTYGDMHRSAVTYGLILAAMCFPLDRVAAPRNEEHFIPDCAGHVEIAHARVAGVEQNGVLRLPDGRALLLEGIRLPLADGAPRVLAAPVLASLRRMARVSTVAFTTTLPKEDRYGRPRVQGLGQQWLQIALLEQGLARLAISPDRDECAPGLYEAEARARATRGDVDIAQLSGAHRSGHERNRGELSAGRGQGDRSRRGWWAAVYRLG
jgi:hypothetical protein